jgi:glutamine amidotransferase
MRVLLLDTGLGNLRSVEKALCVAGARHSLDVVVERSADPDRIRAAPVIVFPGQGGFRDCMRALANGPGQALLEKLASGTPYLGICLGLQVLFERSSEAPTEPGLALYPGQVERLSAAGGVKIPHMGWNQLELQNAGHPCLAAAGGDGAWMYFVHSFHAVPADRTVVVASAVYGENRITSAIARDNVLAVQFHPEKSQAAGLELLADFLRRANS